MARKDSAVKIAILGAGSWGTTLAWLMSGAGKTVSLWSHDSDKARRLNQTRKLEFPLKMDIPPAVQISDDLPDTTGGADIILFCSNSQSLRVVAQQVAAVSSGGKYPILVSAAKGLELNSLKRMSQVLGEALPEAEAICSLSGPNLAGEILQKLPTAAVVASENQDAARFVQQHLSVAQFRLYTSNDLAGVELGGTLKNVIAIAAGCSDGLKLGTNAKAALLTRGLAEMTRLAIALGARASTLSGLSGMGDLFATCSSLLSRNYRLGLKIAEGEGPAKVISELGGTAEGAPTAAAVCELSQKLDLALPIAEQVNATLMGTTTARGAIMTLMSRPLVSEQ